MEQERPTAAWRTGWKAAELGKQAKTNPYKGEPDKSDFVKGFYAWLMYAKKTLKQ
jgi:hypothetical protein